MRKINFENIHKNGKTFDWMNSKGAVCDFIYDDICGEITILSATRVNGETIVTVKYNGAEYDIRNQSFKACRIQNIIGIRNTDYNYKIGDIFDDIKLTGYTRKNRTNKNSSEKAYEYECLKCGYRGVILETQVKYGNRCQVCHNRIVVAGINDLYTTVPSIIKFLVDKNDAYKYTKYKSKKIQMKCPDCGTIRSHWINAFTRNGFTCRKCGDNICYPNKFMFNMLTQLDIDFIPEYSPEWAIDSIGTKRVYDFYMPSKKLIIEMDGSFHYQDNRMNGVTMEQTRIIDCEKDKMANDNGIDVIRINCEESNVEYIMREILNSKINLAFDLNKIDWNLIDENASSSRVKEVCNIWMTGIVSSTLDISNMTKISRQTVIAYLKKGASFGWCDYDPRVEHLKAVKENGKYVGSLNKRKEIEVFKDGISLGVYESMSIIEEISTYKFGIKFTKSSIGKVCAGKQRQHKGYIFKYTGVEK